MNMVVAYDIANPRRLNRIARIMKDYGRRVQKSIFKADVAPHVFEEMRRRTEKVMVHEEDGVKYFPLCERCADTLVALGVCAVTPEEGEYLVI